MVQVQSCQAQRPAGALLFKALMKSIANPIEYVLGESKQLPHFRLPEPSKTRRIMRDYFFLSLKQEIKFANYLLLSNTRVCISLPRREVIFMLHKKHCMLFFLFLWEVALCLESMLACCFNISIRDSLPFEPLFSEVRKLQFIVILNQHFCYRRDD